MVKEINVMRWVVLVVMMVMEMSYGQLLKQQIITQAGTWLTYTKYFNVYYSQTVILKVNTRCMNLHTRFVDPTGRTLCENCLQYYSNGATATVSCNLTPGTNYYLYLYDLNGWNNCNWNFTLTLSYYCSTVTANCYDCSSTTTCTSCNSGYYLSSNRCYSIPSGCTAMWGGLCTACQSTYFLSSNICRLCSTSLSNCITCTSSTNCLTCTNAYAVGSNGLCQLCAVFMANCVQCSGNNTCTKCGSGYVQTTANSCQQCSVAILNCLNCASSTNCLACAPGYAPQNGGVACNTCSFFMANCIQCSSNTTCTRCGAGFGVSAGSCFPCSNTDVHCISCDTLGNCLDCEDGYGPGAFGICVDCSVLVTDCIDCSSQDTCTKCSTGNAIFTSTPYPYECKPCSTSLPNCIQCSSNSTCTKCVPFYALSASSLCYSCSNFLSNCIDCSDRFTCTLCATGYAINYQNTCSPCNTLMSNCLRCSSRSTCTLCNSGFAESSGICQQCSLLLSNCTNCANANTCTRCQVGFALDSTHKCKTCGFFMNNCAQCTDNQTCTICVSGLVLHNSVCKGCNQVFSNCVSCSNNVSCSICELGYAIDGNLCKKCHPLIKNCEFCSDKYTCEKCLAPYDFNPHGQCRCLLPLYQVNGLCIDDPNCRSAKKVGDKVVCYFCDVEKLYILDSNKKCVCKKGFKDDYGYCRQICGDGLVFSSECDDGNSNNGDGCSSSCRVQPYFICNNPTKGVSICKFNKLIKFKLYYTDKVLSEDRAQIHLTLDSQNSYITDLFNSNYFDFNVTHNRSQCIQLLKSYRNDKNQIVIQIAYNITIQDTMIDLGFQYPSNKVVYDKYHLKFQLKGNNYPLIISSFNQKFDQISDINFYIILSVYVLVLLVLLSDKFIGVEAINSIQLVFFSLLLMISNDWPQAFSTILPLKYSTGFNQLLFQLKKFQNMKDLTYNKFRYLTIYEYFLQNNFTNTAILSMIVVVFIILYCIKTSKQNKINLIGEKDARNIERKKFSKFSRVFKKFFNLVSNFSYIMILQVFVSLYVQASYLKNISPQMKILNKFSALITSFVVIFTVLQNFKHLFLSENETAIENYRVGSQEKHYKRVYFIYIFFNAISIFVFNDKIFFSFPTSAYLCITALAYFIYLLRYRPYKYSFSVHAVTVLINHMGYQINLVIITLINLNIDIPQKYLLVYAYILMGICILNILLMAVRMFFQIKYGAEHISNEVKKQINEKMYQEDQKRLNQMFREMNQQKNKQQVNEKGNPYIYANRVHEEEQIQFLNELKAKYFLSQWERDSIYYQFYQNKPLKWIKSNQKPEVYEYLLQKQRENLQKDPKQLQMIRKQQENLTNPRYVQQLRNVKQRLRKEYQVKKEKRQEKKMLKKNKNKD